MNYWESKLRAHLASAHGCHEYPPVSTYAELKALHDERHAAHDAQHADVFYTAPIVVDA